MNKLTTMGYFIKRLRDSGYVVDRLYTGYNYVDPRAWSVVIDPGGATIFCSCYHNDPQMGTSYFEIYDGGQFIPGRFKITTSSVETFVSYLVKFGVNNKYRGYLNDKDKPTKPKSGKTDTPTTRVDKPAEQDT